MAPPNEVRNSLCSCRLVGTKRRLRHENGSTRYCISVEESLLRCEACAVPRPGASLTLLTPYKKGGARSADFEQEKPGVPCPGDFQRKTLFSDELRISEYDAPEKGGNRENTVRKCCSRCAEIG